MARGIAAFEGSSPGMPFESDNTGATGCLRLRLSQVGPPAIQAASGCLSQRDSLPSCRD